MNKYLLLNLLCWFALPSMAQITYTSISFPRGGNVLSISTAAPDTLLTVTPPNTAATAWDFSNLVAVNTVKDTIRLASEGADSAMFPTADVLQPLIGQLGIAYTDVTTTKIERLGGGLELLGLSFVAPYANTHITQIVPLTYGNIASDTYTLRYGENIDSVPFLRQIVDSLITNIPFNISPDSIRFAIEGEENRHVDAWGTCMMADTTYNVIRQKVVTEYSIKIEARAVVPFLGPLWINVTTFLPLPFPTRATVVRYDFLAEGVKQPIVTLNLDSAETIITSVTFLDTIINNQDSTINVHYIQDQIEASIYPNPAQQQIMIEIAGADMPVNGYNLLVVDMLGRVVLVENAIKNETHQVSVANIANGQYVMVLRDKSGEILKRQMIEILR